MINPGMKKYAEMKGLKITRNVAYGYMDGYLVTLIEGWGIKKVSVSCDLTEQSIEAFDFIMSDKSFRKKYHLDSFEISVDGITIGFINTVYTVRRLTDCLENILEILKQNSIPEKRICPCCDKPIEYGDEVKIVLNDDFVHKAHGACADELVDFTDLGEFLRKTDKASGVKGVLGALLFGFAGSIPMVILSPFIDIYPVFGMLIGVCTKFGYEIAKGNVGKSKFITVFSCSVINAALGIFFSFVQNYSSSMAQLPMPLPDATKLLAASIAQLTPLGISYIADFGIAALIAFSGAYLSLQFTYEDDKNKIFRAKILESAADVKEENKNEF